MIWIINDLMNKIGVNVILKDIYWARIMKINMVRIRILIYERYKIEKK